jgi:hypothetical protein
MNVSETWTTEPEYNIETALAAKDPPLLSPVALK